LIQDVLLFARGESIGREIIAVDDWVGEAVRTVEPLCVEKEVDLRLPAACPGQVVVGDRKALVGALLNLLENALQVSAAGSEISLQVTVVDRLVALAVDDHGPGMDSALSSRVFEPFFTTRSQGTGLGLAIALGVARAHGGNISVTSTPGQGSLFRLTLPVGRADDFTAV
jgi:two-component system sensor histidine kinase FlrB